MNKNDIKNLINKDKNIIVLEIGSADGFDTQDFLNIFSDTKNFKIYCFEPDSRNLTAFKDYIHDDRVSLFEGVVGNEDGDVTFYTSTKSFITGQELIYSSSLRKPGKDIYKLWPTLFQNENNFSPIIVKSIKLDTFVKNNNIGKVDFIWMDVQGCEDLAILGGIETLNMKVKYFYTEYNNDEVYVGNPNMNKIMSMLPHFSLVQDFGTDVLLVNNLI